CVEIEKQLVDLIDDLGWSRILPIDLVDDGNRRQACLERFAQNEARLWQTALGGVYQQHYAVDHCQHALDFTAKISVARRVDDVDLHTAVMHRSVFRHNGDAALAL